VSIKSHPIFSETDRRLNGNYAIFTYLLKSSFFFLLFYTGYVLE